MTHNSSDIHDTSSLSPHELDKFEKQLLSLSSSFNPSQDFSTRMRRRLARHHALLLSDPSRQPVSGLRRVFSFFSTRVYATVSAFGIVLLTGGVSTFAYTSDSVTHGTPLYPIKRGIEAVEQAIHISQVSQASYRVKILDRRLQESRYLTSQGVADQATNDDVSIAVNDGLQVVQTLPDDINRDSLLNKMTQLLKRQEAALYEIAGVAPPVSVFETAAPVPVDTASGVVPAAPGVSATPQSPFIETAQPVSAPAALPPSSLSRTITLPPVDITSPAPLGESQRGYSDSNVDNSPSLPGDSMIRGVPTSPRVEIEIRPSTIEPRRAPPVRAVPAVPAAVPVVAPIAPPIAMPPVPAPAGVSAGNPSTESNVFDAVRKNSQHLRQIEMRVLEMRRQR